jgi:hypothetical protein
LLVHILRQLMHKQVRRSAIIPKIYSVKDELSEKY